MSSPKFTSEKMNSMPMGKLLAVMSLPAILSMLVQSLYNVVDSIFVSALSPFAMDAIAIAFPMQIFTLAFAIGIGIGTNSVISRRLGERKREEATAAAKNGLFLALVVAAVFVFIGLFVSKPFMMLFTEDAVVLDYGVQYLTIVTALSFGMFVEILCSKVFQSIGNMIIPMVSQLLGAGINLILDPLLIFGLLGFPALGMRGAAIATVIGQCVAMAFTLTVFFSRKHEVSISLRGFKPSFAQMKHIIVVGAPAMFINAIGSVTIFIMNFILKGLSDAAITVLGIYFKLQSFVFMPVFGLTQGAMPILGYNYGARNKERFVAAFKLTLTVAVCILTFGLLLFQILPSQLLSMFSPTDEVHSLGITALRAISIAFVPAAFAIVLTTMFQAVGHGLKSFLMSSLRQVALLIPSALFLAELTGLNGVWFCYPIAEIFSVSIFLPIALTLIPKLCKEKREPRLLPLEPIPVEVE